MKLCTRILTEEEILDDDKFLAAHKFGIDGYEMTGVLNVEGGRDLYSVWVEKYDKVESRVYKNRFWKARIGQLIKKEFSSIAEKDVVEGGFFRRDDKPYMQANVDGFVTKEDSGITCFCSPTGEGWDGDNVPLINYVECLWNMAVTDMDKWYIAVLVNDNYVVVKEIERDEDRIDEMIKKCDEFWESVKKGIPPDTITGSDYCEWAFDYSNYPIEDRPMYIDDGRYDTLCADIQKAKNDIALLKRVIISKESKLKALLGGHQSAYTANYRIKWERTPHRKFDWKRFFKEQDALARDYETIQLFRTMSIYKLSSTPSAIKARQVKRKKDEDKWTKDLN